MRIIHLLLNLLAPSMWYRTRLLCRIEECQDAQAVCRALGDEKRARKWAKGARDAQDELAHYDLCRIRAQRLKSKAWEKVILLVLCLSLLGSGFAVAGPVKLTYDPSGCYIVQKGDTLSGVAFARYGDASRWEEIYLWHHQRGIGPVPDRVLHKGGKFIVNIRPGAHLWLH